MESINIAGFDAGVDTWSSGGEHVLQAQRASGVLRVHRDPAQYDLVAEDRSASARLLVIEAPSEMVQRLSPS